MIRNLILLTAASRLAASAALPADLNTAAPPAADATTAKQDTQAAGIWQPAVGAKFQMILSGVVDIDSNNPAITPDVEIYDIDLFDTPKETIKGLKKLGKKVICYFSGGTSEDWRPDFSSFASADQGANLPAWAGEKWLDVRSSKVLDVMKKRIKLAADNGCDAIDPDNMGKLSTCPSSIT